MYNAELKMRYIKEKNNSVVLPVNYLMRNFNKSEKYEIGLGKDVYNFKVCEIIEYYKTLNVASLEIIAVLNSHFSMYTQWCIKENLVENNQNNYAEIKLEYMQQCLNKTIVDKKIISRGQIIEFCEQLPNPKDQVVLLGLFEGMKGKDFCDFVNLKPEDIYGNKVRLASKREIDISDILLKYINDSIEETMYYSISEKQEKVMPLVDNGYVIKSYPNIKEGTTDFIKGRIIYNGIARSLNYVGVLGIMSSNSIYESGKLYMIKREAKKHKMTMKDYIYSDLIKNVEYQYNCSIPKSTFCIKYKDYLI